MMFKRELHSLQVLQAGVQKNKTPMIICNVLGSSKLAFKILKLNEICMKWNVQ